MIKEILTYPKNKEILTSKSEEIIEIDDEIKELAQDLIDTLKNTQTGVGISAVQIGVLKRMCVIKYNNEYIVMINPVITKSKKDTITFEEGCLSAPGAKKITNRPQKVWVDYKNLEGRNKELAQGGICSIIIQHELDHFDGWCEVFDEIKEN